MRVQEARTRGHELARTYRGDPYAMATALGIVVFNDSRVPPDLTVCYPIRNGIAGILLSRSLSARREMFLITCYCGAIVLGYAHSYWSRIPVLRWQRHSLGSIFAHAFLNTETERMAG